MLAHNKIIPLKICSFGFSDQVNCLLKNKNIIGSVKATVKKYRAHVIWSTGMSALKYLAIPSINGRSSHPLKFNRYANITNYLKDSGSHILQTKFPKPLFGLYVW